MFTVMLCPSRVRNDCLIPCVDGALSEAATFYVLADSTEIRSASGPGRKRAAIIRDVRWTAESDLAEVMRADAPIQIEVRYLGDAIIAGRALPNGQAGSQADWSAIIRLILEFLLSLRTGTPKAVESIHSRVQFPIVIH